jgi:hypothetical protein
MNGSLEFHDSIISHLKKNQQTLEQILQDEIISLESNKIINFGKKNNYEIDLFVQTKNSNYPTLIEVKSNLKLISKFNKQHKMFERYFPNSNIYLVYSKCGNDTTNLEYKHIPPQITLGIIYY